jgi:hypothetical protein
MTSQPIDVDLKNIALIFPILWRDLNPDRLLFRRME